MKKFAFLAALGLFSGCSLNSLALRTTTNLLDRGSGAVYDEPDPRLAEDAMPSQLELLQTLLRNDPDNPQLLRLAAEGFGGYAFLFLEDSQPERAKAFYRRGRDFALKALSRRTALAGIETMDADALSRALKGTGKADVPDLFWAAFGWSNWIDLSKDSPEALAELPKAALLMKRVLALDPGFDFGGPELFFGVYYASRPAILGGDAKKAERYFKKARALTDGKYLMAYVMEARYLAVAIQNKALYTELLRRAEDMPAGALPGAMLADQVAKKKAAQLLKETDDYF